MLVKFTLLDNVTDGVHGSGGRAREGRIKHAI